MNNGLNTLYEFEEFRFDAATGTLWRRDEVVPLPPKVSGVLNLLLERDGGLVSKQDLLANVWADTFVEEGVLTQSIYVLRQTLGQGRPFVLTVARRGYRFGFPVKRVGSEDTSATGTEESREISRDEISVAEVVPAHFAATTSAVTRWRPFHLVALIGFAAVAGFALYFTFWRDRATESPDKAIAPIEQLRFQRLTDSGDVVYPTISPNGELLAYVRLQAEQGSVWVKQIATDSAVEILPATAKGYRSLAFSPDGKYLFFRNEADGSSIYQCSVLGGTPKKVVDNVWSDFGVSPDGTQLSFIRREADRQRYSIVLSRLDGSGETVVAVRESPLDFRSMPAFSNDGRQLAVVGGTVGQTLPKLYLIDIANPRETELPIPRWRVVQRALWMPGGKQLIVSARDANEPYSQLWLYTLENGEVRRLTNDLEAYFWISISGDGKKVVTRQQRIFSHLWYVPDGDIRRAKQITTGGRNLDGYAGVAWTHDKKIIYSAFVNNVTDLFLVNPDGSGRVQLTENAGQDNYYPSLSPDGKLMVFLSNRSGNNQIFTMNVDGRNQKLLVASEKANDRLQSPVFSPDGASVYFLRRNEGRSAIFRVPATGGDPEFVWQPDEGSAENFISFSPDGSKIAYHHVVEKGDANTETPTFRICVRPIDGSQSPKCFELPARRAAVQWHDDNSFDFAAGAFNTSTVLKQRVDGDLPEKLFEVPERVFGMAWSPDKKDLVLARGRQNGDALLITNLP